MCSCCVSTGPRPSRLLPSQVPAHLLQPQGRGCLSSNPQWNLLPWLLLSGWFGKGWFQVRPSKQMQELWVWVVVCEVFFKITFRCVPHKEGREIGRFWWLRTEPGEGKVLCLDKTPGTPHSSTQHKELLPECWCLLQIRCYYSQWETIWYFHWSCKLRSKFNHCAVMDCSHVLFSWRYQMTGSINHYRSKMV